VSIYFFFFNLYLSGHGYSEAQLGMLTGTIAAGNLAGAFPAGRLIQRRGLRSTLIACVIAAPVVLCARSLSPSFPFQLALAFLTGLALCLWAVCQAPFIAAITGERERPLAFSLVFSLGIGVGALGALAGSRMPGWFSRHFAFSEILAPDQLTLIAACCIAAIAVIPAVALRAGRTIPPPPPGSLWSPAVRRILPAIGIWGLVAGSFFPFANVFLAVHLRLPLHSVGTVFSLSQLCQVAAVLCAPLVFRRLGVSNGVFTMQMATASCFLVLALTANPVAASMTYITLTGMQWMGEPGIYSMMMKIVPEESRGGASASMALVLGAAQLIAATGAGWTFTYLGYPRALGIIALVALTAGLLFKMAGHAETRALVPVGDGGKAE
jgi:MFS family permease